MPPRWSVLLVNPPAPPSILNKEYLFPPSLLYLAGTLQHAGVDVQIFDCNILRPWEAGTALPEDTCLEALERKVKELSPQLVGIGCLFSGQFSAVAKFARHIKQLDERIAIVTGGIHPTVFAGKILEKCPEFDFIVLGEGEKQLLDLCHATQTEKSVPAALDGIAYRHQGEIVVRPKKTFFHDLDAVPFPAYNLINFFDYQHDLSHWHNPWNIPFSVSVPVITSRSCPNRCSFCSMFMTMGPRFRARSARNVVDEISLLYDTYNIRHFGIMDDNFTYSKKRTLEICSLIQQRGLKFQFETLNGLMTRKLDDEIIDAMASVGWVRGAIAIESGSDYLRNTVIRKNLAREKIYDVVASINRYSHIHVKAYYVFGMPEETKETARDTYTMIEDLAVHESYVTNVIPFPGTELFRQCDRDELFTHKVDQNDIFSDVFYYTDNKRFFIKPYQMSIDDLIEWRTRFDDLLKKKKRLAVTSIDPNVAKMLHNITIHVEP